MKLEFKENMYIRTKDGIIDKVIIDYNGHCASPNCECKHISCAKNYYDEDKIVKASYNIIDILEENDYVNGLRVEKNKYGELYTSYVYYGGDIGKQCEVYTTWLKELKEDMIYSVVTKEQFKASSYRIGDDK